MTAMSEKIPLPPSVTQLECLATKRAALFVQEVGLCHTTLEGDSETIINSLKRGDMFQSAFEHLIHDTLAYVEALESCTFSHVLRQGNSVADALAKKAKFGSSLTVWMKSVPLDICPYVMSDRLCASD